MVQSFGTFGWHYGTPKPHFLEDPAEKHGRAETFKARFVAGENRQVFEENCENIYALVVDFTVFLLILISSCV